MVEKCDGHKTMNQNSNIWHRIAEIKEKFTTLIMGFLPPDQMDDYVFDLVIADKFFHSTNCFSFKCTMFIIRASFNFFLFFSCYVVQFVIQFVLNDAKPKIKLSTKIQSTKNHTKNTIIWCECYYLCLLSLSFSFYWISSEKNGKCDAKN